MKGFITDHEGSVSQPFEIRDADTLFEILEDGLREGYTLTLIGD